MNGAMKAFLDKIYFSYHQFFIFDKSVRLPGCDWTDDHFAQGFARRESNVCFASILEYGHADVSITLGRYERRDDYQRVIAVPFLVKAGEIRIIGPEEVNVNRKIAIP